jgi:rhodanese-related sulfurtransferase
MQKRKITIGTILVMLLLATFVLVQPAFAKPHTTEPRDVSVQQAYAMIKHQSRRNPVLILDVRNQSEYDLGHLYDSVLIPLYELDDRINELTAQLNMNDKIIVYCQAGSRSAIACEILAEHGFTRVYNMLGGITAWMQANYPISTSYHHVTVDKANNGERVILDIDPLLLYQTECTSCNQNQTCSSDNEASNVTVTVLEEDENHRVISITYEVNGSKYEVITNKTTIWRYNTFGTKSNRTITFNSIEMTTEGLLTKNFVLTYAVQHTDYNLTLITALAPLDTETYNSSFTIMNYAPAGKTEILSLEFVDFNTPITLSQQYAILSEVAKRIGQIYAKSGDENLIQFAERYYIMAEEAMLLSKIVKKELPEYNKNILNSKAIVMDSWDTCFWGCIESMISWLWDSGIMTICAGICFWCIVPPHVQCIVCAACLGAPVSGCVGLCYFLCWLGAC